MAGFSAKIQRGLLSPSPLSHHVPLFSPGLELGAGRRGGR